MNKLEGKLVRGISRTLEESIQVELMKINSQGRRRTTVNIVAWALTDGSISIDQLNKFSDMSYGNNDNSKLQTLLKAMSVIMLTAIGYARHENNLRLVNDLSVVKAFVVDEASIKKELSIKGWVTHTYHKDNKIARVIAISTAGDCFIFDGSARCRYYIWDFQKNEFKMKQNKTGA